jgi:transposase
MRRHELTDFEWAVIEPLLPRNSRGVPRVDDRRVINGILWRFRTGSSWRDVPERYGPRTTLYNRFTRWRAAGVWDRLLEAVSRAYDGDIVMIDSSCVRVHQHGAAGKRGACRSSAGTFTRRPDHQDPCPGGCRGKAGASRTDRWASW